MSEKKRAKKSNFIVQGGILAIAGVIVRMIGAVKRIPLTNIIGDEGNAYYAIAYELYSIILIISSYSIPLAVSKIVSARVGKGQYRNANRIFKGALLFATVTGGIACVIVFFFADFLAAKVMLEPMSAVALRMLAPTLFIVAIMGVFRGYFQGLGTMMPTAVSQIVEQIFAVLFTLLGAYFLFGYGLKIGNLLQNESFGPSYGAAGGAIGPGVGALIGLAFLLFVFSAYRTRFKKQIIRDATNSTESYSQIFKVLMLTIIPVVLSTAVYNISNIIDQRIYNDVMISKGLESIRTIHLGVYSGKYRVLINIPIALGSAMCASIIPSLTATMARKEFKAARYKISAVIRVTMMITIPCAVGLAVLARPVVDMLFNGEIDLAANLLYVGTISIVLYTLSTLTNGILQGINCMRLPVRHAFISLIIHVVAIYVMLDTFELGIYSLVYANIIFAFCMCILNGLAIRKHMSYKQEVRRTFLIPTISAGVMGLILFILFKALYSLLGNTISTIVSIIVGIIVYFVLVIVLKGITEKELQEIPMGKTVAKVAKKLHLL